MASTVGILFTISTYGTWLRGDARGWVDDGVVFPPDPTLEVKDAARLKYDPFYFDRDQRFDVGRAIGEALIDRLNLRVYALTVQSWHAHGLVGSTRHHIADVIKCAKDAARWHLRLDRPVWAADFDKRWCFDWRVVAARMTYVEKHNLQNGWNAMPWPFLVTPPELR